MHKIPAALAAAAMACTIAPAAHAESSNDLKEVRAQIQQLKRDYEERIRSLEQRLAAAEQKAAQADRAATEAKRTAGEAQQQVQEGRQAVVEAAPMTAPPAPDTVSASPAQQERQNAFNPAISLILEGTYADFSQDPDTYHINGFMTPPEAGPGDRGLSIAETELAISGSIDPWFSGYFTAALQPQGEIEVENAYFQTSALGHGFTLEGGRFFSDIGYLNPQHQHAWDFVDAPLPYQAFLGGQLADDGVQLEWVAPTELLIELGGEVGRGQNFPGAENNLNGAHLYTLFGHVGGDIGASNSWRAGVSYLNGSPKDRTYDDLDSTDTDVTNAFSGTSQLWIADLVWKWAPDGNPTRRNFKLQGEYFWRDESGTLTFDQDGVAGGPSAGHYSSNQDGWYAQAVYQFMPRWRIGLRYSELASGNPDIGLVDSGALPATDFPLLASYNPSTLTGMIDWSPSEFSRFRVQYGSDESREGATDNQLYLQYIMSLGAHGAHTW
jgi:hypothetical protein